MTASSCLGSPFADTTVASMTASPMTRLIHSSKADGGRNKQRGAMGYVLGWLLGVPIPILIIIALLRGCS